MLRIPSVEGLRVQLSDVVSTVQRNRRAARGIVILGVAMVGSFLAAASATADQPPQMNTPASFSVSGTGAFTYSVPLAIPPGTAGMTPVLSLDYTSQGGDGLEGVGFSLTGLPAVTRCPRTLGQDQDGSGNPVHGAVNYNANDRFCLEGQRLVSLGATSQASSICGGDHPVEYRTEIDGFSRIVSCGADTSGAGPLTFRVWTKTGQIMEFGTSTDSQLHPVAYDNNGRGSPIAAVGTWGVHKISDVKGNYLLVTYNCGTGASCTETDRVQNGQMYPLVIAYTGNGSQQPYNSIVFTYADRAWQGGVDHLEQFQANTVTTLTKQLSVIATCTTVPTAGSLCPAVSTVRQYKLGYEWDYDEFLGTHISAERLDLITECDGANACLPPIRLQWGGYNGLDRNNIGAQSYGNNTAHGKTQGKPNNFNADFNGDGITDAAVLIPDNYTCQQHAANPTPYLGENLLISQNGAYSGWQFTSTYPGLGGPMQANYNHDNGSGGPNCDGNASFYNTQTTIVDYDGDGYSDVAARNMDDPHRVFLLRNNRSGTFGEADGFSACCAESAYLWYPADLWADFNGDGRSDYVKRDGTSNSIDPFYSLGNDQFGDAQFVDSQSTKWMQDKDSFSAGDFDGDGCADIFYLKQSGSAQQSVYKFCNTDLPFDASNLTDFALDNQARYALGDFNGDGKTDIFKYGDSGAPSALWVSTGETFRLIRTDLPAISNQYTPVVGDYNGDGRQDIAFIPPQSLNNQVQIWISAPPSANGAEGVEFISQNYVPQISGDTRAGVAGDWNSDGATDLWIQDSSSDIQFFDQYGGPHLLIQIDSGLGVTTLVNYDRINQNGSFYAKSTDASYPTQDVDGPLYVVKEIDSGNGQTTCYWTSRSNCYVSTYSYGGLKADLHGRGLLGFSQVNITDAQTHVVQTTNYYTQFPFTGLIASQTKTCPHAYCGGATDVVLASTVNCYQDPQHDCTNPTPTAISLPGGDIARYFLPLRRTTVVKNDADGTSEPTVQTDYDYDCDVNSNPCYGLSTEVKVTTTLASDQAVQDTNNTFQPADTTNWYVDRLATASVTSTLGTQSITRNSQFTYDPVTGMLAHEIVEPNDSGCFYLDTAYRYDSYGNKQFVTSTPHAGCGAARTAETDYDATTYKGAFVAKITNPLNQYETYDSYNAGFGEATLHHDPNQLATSWSYDTFGRKLAEKHLNPDASIHTQIALSYYYCSDTAHLPANETCRISPNDGSDTISAFFFVVATPENASGAQNGPTNIIFYDGLARSLAKDAQGFDGSWVRVATEYDVKGRVSRTSRPFCVGLSAATPTCPASANSPKWTTNSYANTTTGYDDPLGRVLKLTRPDGSYTTLAYDGQTTTQTVFVQPEATSEQTTTVKNARGLVASVSDANGTATSYTYDAENNLTKVVAPGNVKTTFKFDPTYARRKVQSTDPDFGTWSYAYDAYSELTQQTDNKGQITTLAYDLLGRIVQRNAGGFDANWEFDTATNGVGKLHFACVRSDGGSGCSGLAAADYLRTLSYDSLGRASGVSLKIDASSYAYAASYTADDRMDTLNYPSGFAEKLLYVATYGYACRITDGSNPATSCSDTGGTTYWTANVRDWEGRLAQQTVAGGTSGVQTIQAFDANTGRVTQIRASNDGADDSSVASFSYGWDSAGNLLQRVDGFENVTDNYCYDLVNRLTNSSLQQQPGDTCSTGTHKKVIAYASNGNITKKNDVCNTAQCYTYGANAGSHALTGIVGTLNGVTNPTFTYDANGNMLCELAQGQTTCDATAPRQISWTAFDMVSAITEGSVSSTFTYDAEHSRIKQIAMIGGMQPSTRLYLNALGGMSERATLGALSTWHDYIQVDGRIIADRVKTPSQVSTSYFVLDHLGTVSVITDGTPSSPTFGQVMERDSYDAWGKHRDLDGTDDANCTPSNVTTRGYTNQEMMDNVCMVNLNARVYDPTLARFLSADPATETLFNLQVLNRYSYVGNNPLSYTDPTGLCFLGCFWNNGIFRSILAIIAAAVAQEELSALELSGLESGAQLSVGQSVLNAGISGGISGYISTGKLNGAIMGALESSAFAGVHIAKADFGVDTSTFGGAMTSAGMHAMVGGMFSMARGQSFQSGFLSAGFSDLAGSDTDSANVNAYDLAKHALYGGLGSVLGGGKFADGAATGAFGYLFNEHLNQTVKPPGCWQCLSPDQIPHDNGDCALYGCDDEPAHASTPPVAVGVTIGGGPAASIECDADGSCFIGAGAGYGASAKFEVTGTADLAHWSYKNEPYGWVIRVDGAAGGGLGGGGTYYINLDGMSAAAQAGYVDGISGTITFGYRFRPLKVPN